MLGHPARSLGCRFFGTIIGHVIGGLCVLCQTLPVISIPRSTPRYDRSPMNDSLTL